MRKTHRNGWKQRKSLWTKKDSIKIMGTKLNGLLRLNNAFMLNAPIIRRYSFAYYAHFYCLRQEVLWPYGYAKVFQSTYQPLEIKTHFVRNDLIDYWMYSNATDVWKYCKICLARIESRTWLDHFCEKLFCFERSDEFLIWR